MTNIKGQLTLSGNSDAAEVLSRFYRQFMNAYKIKRGSYRIQLECNEQYTVAGVILSVIGGSMYIKEIICQESLTKDILIEFATHHHDRWAINSLEHPDLVVFLYHDFIYALNYDDFHEFCISNRQLLSHDVGVLVKTSKSDDVNPCVKVPIDLFLELYVATGNDFIKQVVLG